MQEHCNRDIGGKLYLFRETTLGIGKAQNVILKSHHQISGGPIKAQGGAATPPLARKSIKGVAYCTST